MAIDLNKPIDFSNMSKKSIQTGTAKTPKAPLPPSPTPASTAVTSKTPAVGTGFPAPLQRVAPSAPAAPVSTTTTTTSTTTTTPGAPVTPPPAAATVTTTGGVIPPAGMNKGAKKAPLYLAIGLGVLVIAGLAAFFLLRKPAAPTATNTNTTTTPPVTEEPTPTTPADADQDDLSDEQEATLGTNPAVADTDGDGLLDGEEVNLRKTDPLKEDTDADGLTDQQEVEQYDTDPLVADSDADGLTDKEEVVTYKTDPKKDDTDGDTFKDGDEVKNGYNPNGSGRLETQGGTTTPDASLDTDGDGLTDKQENEIYHTDPTKKDTDGDTYSDGDEVKNGYNPNGPGRLTTSTVPAGTSPVIVGATATFTENTAYSIQGMVKVKDAKTLELSNFSYSGRGSNVQIRLAKGNDKNIATLLTISGKSYSQSVFTLTLPESVTLSMFDSVTIYDAEVNISLSDAVFGVASSSATDSGNSGLSTSGSNTTNY